MQFSSFSRKVDGLTITLFNQIPAANVGTLKYYKDNRTGTFSKIEFRWSFNDTYWSSWAPLTQVALSEIVTYSNYYFFLEVRYVLTAAGSGTVSTFMFDYIPGTSTPASLNSILTENIQHNDASAIVIHDVMQTYKVNTIVDASTLNGYPGSFYLNRTNHTGKQPISSITGLEQSLNYLSQNSSDNRWVYIDRKGFLNQTDTVMEFDTSTNIFTLGASTPGATWTYMRKGLVYNKTADLTVLIFDGITRQIPTETMRYYIYIDGNGILSCEEYPPGAWNDPVADVITVAILVYNPYDTPLYHIAEERHSCLIDARLHTYLHISRGTVPMLSSFYTGDITGPTINGSTNYDNTLRIIRARIADEDIIHILPTINRPDGNTPTYHIFYRNDSSTSWRWNLEPVPYKYNSTTEYFQWDNNGIMTDGVNDKYYTTYLLYTLFQNSSKHVFIPGRGEYDSIMAAETENPNLFDYNFFPIPESIIAYQFIWKVDASLTNLGKVSCAHTPSKLMITTPSTVSNNTTSFHNVLAGIQGDHHSNEYYHLNKAQYDSYDSLIDEASLGNSFVWNNGMLDVSVSGGGMTQETVTYAQLVTKIQSSALIPETLYKLTDFATTHYLCDSNGVIINPSTGLEEINTGSVEALILKANSSTAFYPEVYNIDYPHDIISYDWDPSNWIQDISFSADNVNIIPNFKGVIYRREDTKNNNILGYDFRNAKFRRWKRNDPIWIQEQSYLKYDKVQVLGDGVYLAINDVPFPDPYERRISITGTSGTISMSVGTTPSNGIDSFFDTSIYTVAWAIDQYVLTYSADFLTLDLIVSRYGNDIVYTSTTNTQFILYVSNSPTGDLGLSQNDPNILLSNTAYWMKIIDYSISEYWANNSNSAQNESDFIDCLTFVENGLGTYDTCVTNNIFTPFKDDQFKYLGLMASILSNNVFYLFDTGVFTVMNNSYGALYELNTHQGWFYCNTFGDYNYFNTFGNDNSHNTFGNYNSYFIFGSGNYFNTFGHDNGSFTFGHDNIGNTFGQDNSYDIFAAFNSYNAFGNNNTYNTFGDNNSFNTFRNNNSSNTFGNYNHSNTFGIANAYNTFGHNNSYNTFVDSNTGNIFGDSNSFNTFGNNSADNTFGNNNEKNTFGNNNSYNTFGNYNHSNTFGIANVYYTFGHNNINNTFGCSNTDNTFGNSNTFNTIGNNSANNIFGDSNSFNTFGNNSADNTFRNYNTGNIFGNNNTYNIFGDSNSFNTFGNNSVYNTFGNNNHSHTFGNNNTDNAFRTANNNNTFGNNNSYNTFGDSNSFNTFRNNNSNNTFENGNYANAFGDANSYNTFGNNISRNIFGDDNGSNTFGNYNTYNTLGNNNGYNTFGNNNGYNTFKNNNESNIFGDGNSFNTFGYSNIFNDFTGIIIQKNAFELIEGSGIDYSLSTHLVGDYNTQSFKTSTGTFKLKYIDGTDDTEKIVDVNA